MATSVVSNDQLREIRDKIRTQFPNQPVKAWQIKELINQTFQAVIDESTIRGRFIEMGEPLSGGIGLRTVAAQVAIQPVEAPKPKSTGFDIANKVLEVPDSLKEFIPKPEPWYIERPIDNRLSIHFDSSRPGHWKYPIAQGKQGTGKTESFKFYAFKKQLPFILYCAHPDFKLHKYFGDKTIQNGDVKFMENLLVQAIQYPSVILIDEFNYISNENTVDFHALLQNRELFVKDANDGKGKIYRLHDDCKIGFAQNPKSAKYIGGNIKPSSFLGRCTYLTYPEFTKTDIDKALMTKFPNLVVEDVTKFTEFYFACVDAINQAQIPVDISIRQLNNVVDLYCHGMPLGMAVDDGLASIMEAASQPKNKEAFMTVARMVWKDDALEKRIGE